jgi:hypothetical protein
MRIPALAVAAALIALPAQATLDLSSKPTKNMSCSDGECIATDADAVLNVDELAAMLATTDVRVVTDGAVFQDIVIVSPVAWASTHALTLHSNDAIFIRNTITVQGTAALNLEVAGAPLYEKKGAIRFWDTASKLTIDGDDYRLVNSIQGLAAAVAAHPRKNVALANDYNAKDDGQVHTVPVSTELAATFDGLGNRISNFAIWDTGENLVALFKATKPRGVIRNLGMKNVNVLAENGFNNIAGALVAYNGGKVANCYVDGGTVRTDFLGTIGGLVGQNYGDIAQSWANVSVEGAQGGAAGGLVGNAHGHVQDVYALGRVIAGDQTDVGGLIGYSWARVKNAYATGHVSGGQNARVGGFEGTAQRPVHRAYWAEDTSGTSTGIASGHTENVVGTSTAGLQAELPNGFSFEVWAQDPAINNGLPYLKRTPPR